MRSLKVFGARNGRDPALAGVGNRPELLRRKTIGNNSRLLLAAGVLAVGPALYALVTGAPLALLVTSIVLGGALTALAMHQRGQFDHSAMAQVATLMAAGLVLTIADPRFADAGLAMALLGPVLAALVARSSMRRVSWLALLPIIAIALASTLLGLPANPLPDAQLLPASGLGFAIAFAVVAYSAHHINSAFEVHDKAQIDAYRHLIEHVQDAVLRFAADGQVMLASRSAEPLFGCARYQLSGNSLVERVHVLDRPAFLTAFSDASQLGRSRTIEVRMRQDDPRAGSSVPRFIWVEAQLAPILDETASEEAHEVIALLRDITSRKDTEAAMAEARRVAEDASQAKSRFLATIGHELRTPLNAVVGFSEMMTSGIGGQLTGTHKEYAGLIHQSGRHLLEVVSMLLDMSRIEAGKFEIQAEQIAPADIVPACFAMVETMAQARSVRLLSEIEADLPMLTADERVCRQILINLLSNAIKFSHEGGQVSVAVKRQGQSISLSVRDRGIGMAPAALDRIGEPFFQVQDGLTRKYEGTGLGLSIVKGLVELHGGTLRAISEVGTGTTITVLLPINGPATKASETAEIVPLHREPLAAALPLWQKETRKAQ
ncbi:sensor histidine kinase [Devosia aurantiaca]|uniref:histidine kinase n=1 Tax=Devosia aurantiaca TaxID=2714858 RepID=A0A6M1SQ24_9HYPH|nr:PAS domain-containing sensor histidine kinase [Devosia aurantiaca]NGP18666.1 PAS domain S-box protein [Devosia aurantiaca]